MPPLSVTERLGQCREALALAAEVLGNLGLVLSSGDNAALEAHVSAIESALAGIDSILGLQTDIDVDGAIHSLVNALVQRLGRPDDAGTTLGEIRHAVTLAADRLLIGHEHEPGAYWLRDAHGLELCKVCDKCEAFKRCHYRPEILTGYTQADVCEPIEPED